MHNREMPLEVPDDKGGYETVLGERTYYINLLMQLKSEEKIDYKRFRLILSRNGIEGIENYEYSINSLSFAGRLTIVFQCIK